MKMFEPDITKVEGKSIDDLRVEIVEKLQEFLDFCRTDYTGSKYSIMGPVGKLLNLIKTTGDIDWGKIKGYITNVIRTSQNWIAPHALELLDEVCNQLSLIKSEITSPIQWLNIIEGIDYELFFQVYKTDRMQRDKYFTEKFIKYLQTNYKNIEELNTIIDSNFKDFKDISHPREFPNEKIVTEFWTNYNKEKKKKQQNKK